MLKKMMALAATAAMLGANAAAYAIITVRTAVKNVTGDAGGEAAPASGTNIQPSIPPMAAEPPHPEAHAKAAAHKAPAHKVSAHKVSAHKGVAAKGQRRKSSHAKVRVTNPRAPRDS